LRRLRSVLTVLSSALMLTAPMFVGTTPARADVGNADLAYRWAPIHYQDTSSAYYPADYLAPVDYDGDWNTLNNWEDLDANTAGLVGTVYYSVVETSTDWYIVYGFFHARDWKDYPVNIFSHENDMEGLLEVVHKDGSTYGTLNAMVTLAHDNLYSYLPPGSPYTAGDQNIDGNVIMQDFDGASHPASFQEDRGHGCFAWDGGAFPGGDGIVYHPSQGGGSVPTGGDDRSVSYRLVDVFGGGGLWDRRNDPQTYASWGAFAGDNGEDNAAHAPWAWDDLNDGSDIQAGAIATDPAYLISRYFANTGSPSLTYTSNPYTS
jgi:hypothetical protein